MVYYYIFQFWLKFLKLTFQQTLLSQKFKKFDIRKEKPLLLKRFLKFLRLFSSNLINNKKINMYMQNTSKCIKEISDYRNFKSLNIFRFKEKLKQYSYLNFSQNLIRT